MLRLSGVSLLAVLIAACSQNTTEPLPIHPLKLTEGITETVVAPSFLSNYQSCEQIKNDIKERQKKIIEDQMAKWPEEAPHYEYGPTCGDMPLPEFIGGAVPATAAVPASGAAVEKVAEGVDFSGTNNQEKGIDEADIIKVDGHYFYVLTKGKFEIYAILEDGNLERISEVLLGNTIQSFLLLEDKAFVFSNQHEQGYQRFHVDVINLSADRLSPKLEHSFDFEGGLSGARRIKDKIHLALYSYENIPFTTWPDIDDEDYFKATPERQQQLWDTAKEKARQENYALLENYNFLNAMPEELVKEGETYQKKSITEQDCALSYGAADDGASSFLSLITLSDNLEKSVQRVRGSEPVVYASDNQIILASSNNWWRSITQQQTVIHRFKLDETSNAYYADSAAVEGSLINSFALSEYNGYVRVATTVRRDWRNNQSVDTNHLFILGEENGKFDIVSSIENIAPNETIWAARFYQDRAFLVTFEQIDPLFTLDVSDPKNPFVVGELKVPGVSTYLQDIGNNELLAVGYGGDEEGLDFTTNLSVFDVSDFAQPKLKSTLSLDEKNLDDSWGDAQSEANDNHLAINYFAPVGLVAIPVSLSSTGFIPWPESSDWHHRRKYISKLKVVNVQNSEALSLVGEVDHSEFYTDLGEDEYPNPQIRRSYFVGNFLYAFSEYGVTATDIRDMNTIGTHSFVR